MLSQEVDIAINVALNDAVVRRHEYTGVEHLLYALLLDPDTKKALRRAGASVDKLKSDLEEFLETGIEPVPGGQMIQPDLSISLRRVLERALAHGKHSGLDEISGLHVVASMFREPESFAVYLLERSGLTRLNLISYISHGVTSDDDDDYDDDDDEEVSPRSFSFEGSDDEDDPMDEDAKKDPLKAFTSNLNERAAEGKIDPLIGREMELERTVHVLARRRKNNPLFVGDSGVGKTALAEGLAKKIVDGEVPESIKDCTIFSLDMGSLIAGTRYRGDFEARLKAVVKAIQNIPGAVLFIDEIHTVIGAGAVSGGAMDASNLLKPALNSGELRCMGSTTFKEYRNYFEKDRALARRFQKIDVPEPSEEDAVKILQGLKETYEEFHGVTYTDKALEEAVTLSAKHLHDRRLPDKAIDLMDESGALVKLNLDIPNTVDEAIVERVVSSIARIPSQEVTLSDKERLAKLEDDLKGVVFGQDEAIVEVVSAVKLSRAGINAPEKPLGNFIFTGPTGVGKTEVARQLAATLGVELIRFDMSEYMERHAVSRLIGAPPGYVGFDQGGLLTEAVTKNPHCVLLLDEIEKAHPDMFNILLQVMDHGKLTDNNGRTADFHNVILIMTSNVGARELNARRIGFSNELQMGNEDKAFNKAFSPEFRNRLDARIRFSPLQPDVMIRIVEKFLAQLGDQLLQRDIKIEASDQALAYLSKEGYDPLMGARPLARVIKEQIKQPVSEEILFGKLELGGTVFVDEKDGKLTFTYESKEPAEEEEATEAVDAADASEEAIVVPANGEELEA